MNGNYIVGLGEVLWDVLPDGKKLGGAPCNFAFHVSQLGLDSIGVSAVGKDALGDEIIDSLDRVGLGYHIDRVDFPTGTVDVTLDGRGVPCYDIKRDVAWDNVPFTRDLEIIAMQCRAVCFGSLAQRNAVTRDTLHRFLDAMPLEETYRIFDVNLRQAYYDTDVIAGSLCRSDILKLNDEEVVVLSRMFGYGDMPFNDVCWKLMDDHSLKMVILTCGTEGSYVFSPDGITFRPTPKVDVADTVGAGDSFTAAFCSALLKGRSPAFAHELAVDVSAYVCTQSGAMPVLPDSLRDRLR